MPFLIDTNIAIHLRDLNDGIKSHITHLGQLPLLSVVTCVELEGGVYRVPALTEFRRRRLNAMLAELEVLPFNELAVEAYGRILAATGYSRRLILDRMIAATAVVNNMTLVTMNGADFRDIPDLRLEVWDRPEI